MSPQHKHDGASFAELFQETFGRAPAGVWAAPGRVNLIGEHTDYNDGFVFPFAIEHTTEAAIAPRTDGVVRVGSVFTHGEPPVVVETTVAALAPGSVDGWSAYPLGVLWAMGEAGAEITGADILIRSNVPMGAGLSSSAAIESSVALGLNEVFAAGLDRRALARVGRKAENEMVGAPTGIMDQTASLLGERDAAVFLDCRTLETEVVHLGLEAAQMDILVMDTRVSHSLADGGGYSARKASCEQACRILGVDTLRDVSVGDLSGARDRMDDETFRRLRHVVTENERVLETVRVLRGEQGIEGIGPLLDASHSSMRDDFEISCPELDLAVEESRRAGAMGARMTGGGFGGSAIALVRSRDRERISQAVASAFAEAGFTAPNIFTVKPSQGAHRVS